MSKDWTESPQYTKLRIRRIIRRSLPATERSLRDRLAAALWEQRRLLEQCQRDNEEIERLSHELVRWQPPLTYSTGVLTIFQPLIDTANEPGEDEVWAYLNDDAPDDAEPRPEGSRQKREGASQ